MQQFEILKDLYLDWNSKINVISRKDTENFYTRHVLHSLSIAKFIDFKKNTKIMDVGTGGGFPGIPLAIYFKNSSFTLVDSIGKKIKVVDQIVDELKIKNVKSKTERAENISEKFDFIVSRAVTQLERFCPWVEQNISKSNKNEIPNGIIYLKGGDLKEEIQKITKKYNYRIEKIINYFEDSFFESKSILYLHKK
jgi:16S rRNA (guanine527-N7)-methyltransferase|tara:strand:- start:972 stop:1556 length:585 start_codon:yes stop_codon:yes gene_type:complete